MEKPNLENFKPEEINGGQDMAIWYRNYSKALEEYTLYLEEKIDELKELAHDGLPDDCVDGWFDEKMCENRSMGGGVCKVCSNYQE